MRLLGSIVRKLDALSEWTGRIMLFPFLALIVTMMYEVVARYAFDAPTSWSLEVSTMLYSTSLMMAGGYCLLHKTHIKMDLFYARWSDRTKAIVDACAFPLLLIFCGILMWKSGVFAWDATLRLEQSVTAWRYPLWPWKLMIPLAAFLFILQGIGQFIRDLKFAISGKEL